METQSYKTHRRVSPVYDYLLAAIVAGVFVGSLINLYKKSCCHSSCHYMPADQASAWLLTGIATSILFIYFLMRSFAIRAQDRAIRAEENFRHYLLSGKTLDPKLHIKQIVALRFASDEEFIALAQKAVQENLKPKVIKQLIQHWKGDFYRV